MKPLLGLRDPLFALSLLAIDPGLKGVLIGGPSGTGKSMIARAARALWEEKTPFVNLPLSCSVERLLGEPNWEQLQKSGQLKIEAGLLARAHGGILYVDEINLLPSAILHIILQALDSGNIKIEREGLSEVIPADFVLIGTFNPREASLPTILKERVAFTVSTQTLLDVETRMFITTLAGKKITIPEDIIATVRFGKRIINQVQMHPKFLKEICQLASRMGVNGNLAEIFVTRCAKANAALHRRTIVTQGDVDLAVRLIYLPRVGGNVLPGSSESADYQDTTASKETNNANHQNKNSHASQSSSSEKTGSADVKNNGNQKWDNEGRHSKKQKFFRTTEPENGKGIPVPLPEFSFKTAPHTHNGKHASGLNFNRGRHIRAVPGTPSRGRVDLLATLKSASLSNALRQQKNPFTGRISIKKEDLRIKQFRHRSGLLFIFAVDASGSMALNRLQAARGAAISLLKEAYIYRDKVALINFCHQRARVLLSPGESLTRACRVLKSMPVGGRTPLPSALLEAIRLAERAKHSFDVAGNVLVLITDGKANEPLNQPRDTEQRKSRALIEVKRLSNKVRDLFLSVIVIDSRKIFVPDGEGRQLAKWLGAHYIYLPGATNQDITRLIKSRVQTLRYKTETIV